VARTLHTIVRDVAVATRLAARVMGRRLAGRLPAAPDPAAWQAGLQQWLDGLPTGTLRDARFIELPASQPPWTDSGLAIEAGDSVSWFATGRVHLSRALDVWVEPPFQLWGRIGAGGNVFRGTRSTHSIVATHAGTLHLASYFPGEWATPQGELAHGRADYAKVSGAMRVLLLAWPRGTDPQQALDALARRPDAPQSIVDEASRLASPPPAAPEGWEHLWHLGPSEIYRSGRTDTGDPCIRCETHGDVAILRHPAAVALQPGTSLAWRWRVERLPSRLREDSLPSHDYLSVAVEFDDGQDLTYYWSSELPVGTVYRCPLPTWADKETHVVVRSGSAGLGQWHTERRDLYADYRRCIGGPAQAVVRVWLIANSLFQRGHGRCDYAGIAIDAGGERLAVL
jgi:hypothetical protein